jgi:hypothetical protein
MVTGRSQVWMNGGIINSVTRLHLVGYFYWVEFNYLDDKFNNNNNNYYYYYCSSSSSSSSSNILSQLILSYFILSLPIFIHSNIRQFIHPYCRGLGFVRISCNSTRNNGHHKSYRNNQQDATVVSGRHPQTYVKPEAAITILSSWWWAVCRSKYAEQLINTGIINSSTWSHVVVYFYAIYAARIHEHHGYRHTACLVYRFSQSVSVMVIQGVSKRALQLWKLIEIYTEDIHNVLNCQNVAKHTEFYLG